MKVWMFSNTSKTIYLLVLNIYTTKQFSGWRMNKGSSEKRKTWWMPNEGTYKQPKVDVSFRSWLTVNCVHGQIGTFRFDVQQVMWPEVIAHQPPYNINIPPLVIWSLQVRPEKNDDSGCSSPGNSETILVPPSAETSFSQVYQVKDLSTLIYTGFRNSNNIQTGLRVADIIGHQTLILRIW